MSVNKKRRKSEDERVEGDRRQRRGRDTGRWWRMFKDSSIFLGWRVSWVVWPAPPFATVGIIIRGKTPFHYCLSKSISGHCWTQIYIKTSPSAQPPEFKKKYSALKLESHCWQAVLAGQSSPVAEQQKSAAPTRQWVDHSHLSPWLLEAQGKEAVPECDLWATNMSI